MIFIKLLGILDIFAGICFWLAGIFHFIPTNWILILGIILLLKGAIFITGLSPASFLDLISAGIMVLFYSTSIPNMIVIITSLFLIQKGFFSMLG
jgi:hypothetical protein